MPKEKFVSHHKSHILMKWWWCLLFTTPICLFRFLLCYITETTVTWVK